MSSKTTIFRVLGSLFCVPLYHILCFKPELIPNGKLTLIKNKFQDEIPEKKMERCTFCSESVLCNVFFGKLYSVFKECVGVLFAEGQGHDSPWTRSVGCISYSYTEF